MTSNPKQWAVFKIRAHGADVVGRSTTKAGADKIANRILRRECEGYGASYSVMYVENVAPYLET
jgi:hypothetical protein